MIPVHAGAAKSTRNAAAPDCREGNNHVMNYKEALDYIHTTNRFGSKLGLDNMRYLLGLMDNPQDKLRYVHIAGTNGKGSTAAFVCNILTESGYKTGLYTSPFIQRFTERIRIGMEEISEDDLARITGYVKEKIGIMVSEGMNHPTEFEVVTAIAFQYYYECGCDIVVLEVGLGGRLDATNIIRAPEVAVITAIAMDHMDILGGTIGQIASEKVGIIKQGGRVVGYPQDESIVNIISDMASRMGCSLKLADESSIRLKSYGVDGQVFDYSGFTGLKTSLIGSHQLKNAAVAVETALALKEDGWNITNDSIYRGIEAARWPGRLEILMKRPLFMIDGAHNGHGARALAAALAEYFPERKKKFIMGVLKDKDYRNLIEATAGMADSYITVTPPSPRALDSEALAGVIREYNVDSRAADTIAGAVETSLNEASGSDLICAFGSLYYIGIVRGIITGITQK